jgi:protein-tyrosine kinase
VERDAGPIALASTCRLDDDAGGDSLRALAVRVEVALTAAPGDQPTAGAARSVLVTGVDGGAMVTGCRLAVAFAQQGFATYLVDGDFARGDDAPSPVLADRGLVGIADWLADEGAGPPPALATDVANLSILPRGKRRGDRVDALRPDAVTRLNDAVAAHSRRVIWAGPSIASPVGMAIAAAVDGVVLVVTPGRTQKGAADRARAAIAAVGGRLLGEVLHERR